MDLNRWDISNDLMLSRRSKTKNISSGCERQEQLKEMSDMDKEYKWFMLTSLSEAENFKSLKRKREPLDSIGDKSERISVVDPQYELFLGRLKLCEKSYMLEVEKNGVPVVIKYEELGGSEDICVSKLQNKKKNCTGQKNVFVNEKPSLGDNLATKNQVEREVKARSGEKVQRQNDLKEQLNNKGNVRSRRETQTRDVKSNTHRNLRSTIKFHSGDNGGEDVEAVKLSTANEKDGEKNNNKKKKDNESASDFEVQATTEFCKKGNYVSALPSTKLDNSSEFRNKVINIMKKPYNREEYDELRQAVKAQKTEENNGVCTCGKKSSGKSYLNYYPDLHRKLKKFENDRPRNLKTLRGFFFWLEHMKMEGSFKPWKDPECCAVEREHCPPPHPPAPAPAPQRESRKRLATSFEPGDDFESIGVGQENCLSPLPPASRHRGSNKQAIPSKRRNHHESDAVEKLFRQSPSPTRCQGRKRQMSLSKPGKPGNDPEMEQGSRGRKTLNSSKCGEDPKSLK